MTRLYLIAGLALALCISLGMNFKQYLTAYALEQTAPLEQQIQAFEQTAAINTAVSQARVADTAELARLRKQLDSQEVQTITVYRDRVKQLPAPSCSPGHERVAAWNSIALEAP